MTTPLVLETNLEGLNPPKRGKVRDIYDLGETLLIIATDRISAFDVVLPNAVPEKGRVLTQVSKYWFAQTEKIVKNHVISTAIKDFPPACKPHAAILEGRSMLVKKTQPLPVECVVRGYLTGSGLKEYKLTGGQRRQAARGPDRSIPAPGADLYPLDQGGSRSARREHRLRYGGKACRQRNGGKDQILYDFDL
jgi:hypothetical protein